MDSLFVVKDNSIIKLKLVVYSNFWRNWEKKIVLETGPSHPKFQEAKPWMNRYYVL